MEQTTEITPPHRSTCSGYGESAAILLALVGLAVLFFLLWLGFRFLKTDYRTSTGDRGYGYRLGRRGSCPAVHAG